MIVLNVSTKLFKMSSLAPEDDLRIYIYSTSDSGNSFR